MNEIVARALELWSLKAHSVSLAADRENRVYRVETDSGTFALRLHRVGYRTNAELRSELQWMHRVESGGLHIPAPIASRHDAYMHVVDDVQVDLLTWLDGRPLGANATMLDIDNREVVFQKLGAEMAKLHLISDNWVPPEDFSRWHWNRDGLLGEAPLWDRFWDNPTLDREDRELFNQARQVGNDKLAAIEAPAFAGS